MTYATKVVFASEMQCPLQMLFRTTVGPDDGRYLPFPQHKQMCIHVLRMTLPCGYLLKKRSYSVCRMKIHIHIFSPFLHYIKGFAFSHHGLRLK